MAPLFELGSGWLLLRGAGRLGVEQLSSWRSAGRGGIGRHVRVHRYHPLHFDEAGVPGDDSRATGAITGNLLGTLHGVAAIPERWLAQLELRAEVEALALELLASGEGDRYGAQRTTIFPVIPRSVWMEQT